MAPLDTAVFAPPPQQGRMFRTTRAVRIGDTNSDGRLRLDAAARYLQDVGNDDTLELGVGDGGAWVCRKMEVSVLGRYPRLRDQVTLSTFCGGVGSRWAERRTTIATAAGDVIETATLWVHLDPETHRPAPVPTWFIEHYGDACGDRRPDHKLHLGLPPAHAQERSWPLRVTDFDVMAHVNNAIAYAALEDCWAHLGHAEDLTRITVEYHGPLAPDDDATLQWVDDGDGVSCWLTADGQVRVAMRATADG